MEYRRIGSAGLKLSVLCLGSWVTYGRQVDVDAAAACMKRCNGCIGEEVVPPAGHRAAWCHYLLDGSEPRAPDFMLTADEVVMPDRAWPHGPLTGRS